MSESALFDAPPATYSWFGIDPAAGLYDPDLFSPIPRLAKAPAPTSQEKKPQLWFCCGAARSGKSTYAKRWRDNLVTPPGGFPGHRVVWTADNCRLAVTNQRYNRHAEPFVHMMKGYAVKSLMLGGSSILIDGTHTTEESIENVLRIDLDAKPILFETSADVCKERAVATGQEDLLPVIDRMWRQLSVLLDEGLDRVVARLRDKVAARYP